MQLNLLTSEKFGAAHVIPTNVNVPAAPPPPPQGLQLTGDIIKAIVFRTHDGRELVAVAGSLGVWVGVRGRGAMRQVLHAPHVEDMALFAPEQGGAYQGTLILQTGSDVHAYALALISPSSSTVHIEQKKVQLNKRRRDEVGFFSIGKVTTRSGSKLASKPAIILSQKGKAGFRQLRLTPDDGGGGGHGGLLRFMNSKGIQCGDAVLHEAPPFFTDKRNPSRIQFYRADLAVIHDAGVDIIDAELTKVPISLPDFASTSGRRDLNDGGYRLERAGGSEMHNNSAVTRETYVGTPSMSAVRKELVNSQVLGMFSVPKPGSKKERSILLVYRKYGIYVLSDAHAKAGTPDRLHEAFQWEGEPESVVLQGNYLVGISPHLIEIRRVNGRLEQVIHGRNWSLVSGDVVHVPSSSPPRQPSDEGRALPDPQQPILVCQRTSSAHKGYDEQTIFELVLRNQ